MPKQILGRDPAAILAGIQAVLTLLVAYGGLKWAGIRGPEDLSWVIGILAGISAAYLAWGTTETVLAAIVEIVKGVVGIAILNGVNVSLEQQALLITAVTAVGTAFFRTQASPLANLSLGNKSPVLASKTAEPVVMRNRNEVGVAEVGPLVAVAVIILGVLLWALVNSTVGLVVIVVGVLLFLVPLISRR